MKTEHNRTCQTNDTSFTRLTFASIGDRAKCSGLAQFTRVFE